jgi:hypothetical protein
MDDMAERDAISSGSDLWLWDSRENTALHAVMPDHGTSDGATPGAATPADVAAQILAALDPSTDIAVGTGVVAGRSVYELTLTPRSDTTLVGEVVVSVDSDTGLPLQVSVAAKGQASDAATMGFTEIEFGAQPDDRFAFSPPAGTQITELAQDLPAYEGTQQAPGPFPQPTVTGEGWDTIVELPIAAADLTAADPGVLDQLMTPVAEGQALQTSLLSVLFANDGRVLAGAVPLEALAAAAR